jgi:MFS family permease
MTWFGCISTSITAYTAGSYAAGNEQYGIEWGVSEPLAEVGIAIFTAGFGIAPMFLAPFSEINGRRPVFVVAGSLFVIFQLTCALTPTFAGMLVARFLTGCVCSTFSTMVGGVISDFYHAKDRNWAMALFGRYFRCTSFECFANFHHSEFSNLRLKTCSDTFFTICELTSM